MKERPIIFSAPMVRAVLAGTKTQTRRLIRNTGLYAIDEVAHGLETAERERRNLATRSPYGVPGDRLWVREAFRQGYGNPDAHYRADEDECAGGPWRPSIHMPRALSRITLEITDVRVQRLQDISEDDAIAEGIDGPHHVPHRAFATPDDSKARYSRAEAAFESMWDSINGERASWASNPWVWAITFRKVA